MDKESILQPREVYKVDKTLHKENRERLLKNYKAAFPDTPANSIILLKGDITHNIHDNDMEMLPNQEASFWYLFGVEDCDCYGVLELDTGKTTLFCPKLPDAYSLWMPLHTVEYFKANYIIDDARYNEDLESFLKELKPSTILLNNGVNSDSKLPTVLPTFDYLSNYKVDKERLHEVFMETRVYKSDKERELMDYIGDISSEGHIRMMVNVKPGLKEYQLDALYKFHCYNATGSGLVAYDGIVGSGRNAATLHYNSNQGTINDGDLILCDLGCKFYGYASDITTTFPANGKFTEKQAAIYNAVLDANETAKAALKPGAKYGDVHLLAERTIVKHLIKLGIVKDAPLEELEKKRIGGLFFPHGLGHMIGSMVHDVGGYLSTDPQRDNGLGLKNLRTRKVLQAGMCVTIEPGCYFVEFCENLAKNDPELKDYINWDKYAEYKHVGGVRIEDDVYIGENGIQNFVKVPRTIEEVELACAGKEWRKK